VGRKATDLKLTIETFEKCIFLFESRKTIILTAGILGVFRRLKFECDAEIEQKEAFCKGLSAKTAGLPGRYSTFPSCIFRGKIPIGSLARSLK
jgi:hypothetical protein